MKLFINKSKLNINNLTTTEIQSIGTYLMKAYIRSDGYKLNKDGSITIPNRDVTIDQFLGFAVVASGYEDFSIWIEIPNQYANNNIPASLSFSKYEVVDEQGNITLVQRKISDMSILRQGPNNTIYYLQSITSKITKSDLQAIIDSPVATPYSISELITVLNDVNGEYYVPEI